MRLLQRNRSHGHSGALGAPRKRSVLRAPAHFASGKRLCLITVLLLLTLFGLFWWKSVAEQKVRHSAH
jgi:hypothetical protein